MHKGTGGWQQPTPPNLAHKHNHLPNRLTCTACVCKVVWWHQCFTVTQVAANAIYLWETLLFNDRLHVPHCKKSKLTDGFVNEVGVWETQFGHHDTCIENFTEIILADFCGLTFSYSKIKCFVYLHSLITVIVKCNELFYLIPLFTSSLIILYATTSADYNYASVSPIHATTCHTF